MYSNRILSVVIVTLFFISSNQAQDIEPRRWSSLPLGTQFIGVGYGYSFGDVAFDPILEAENVSLEANTVIVSYVKPFKLGGKSARVDVLLPYNFLSLKGSLSGNPASVYRNGFMDSRIRLSLNIIGPEPSNPKELVTYFKEHPKNTTVGVSLAVTIPTGQYLEDKLINLGNNRFVIRPQAGILHNWNNWSLELTGSVFFFTNNTKFFGGFTRKQEPIFAVQTHLIKRFSPSIWASASASYGFGGESIVQGINNADRRTNLLSALSFGFNITKRQGVKIVYLNSRTLKDIGSNTNSFLLAWSHIIL